MKIAIPISIYTGNISKKPIIVDLVNVVAKPIKKAMASKEPKSVVNFCILIITFLFLPISTP